MSLTVHRATHTWRFSVNQHRIIVCPAPHTHHCLPWCTLFGTIPTLWSWQHIELSRSAVSCSVSAASWILITSWWFERTSGGLSQCVHCEPHGVRGLVFNSNHWILKTPLNTYDSFGFSFYFSISKSYQKTYPELDFWLQLSSNVILWVFCSIISALNLIYIYEALLGTHADILVTVAPGVRSM